MTDRPAAGLRMDIACQKETLDNGLDVIVHQDRAVPLVAVNLWYHVGSKNERPGRTGFAHLFEHLMFEGSAHHDAGYFGPLQRAGASLNGSTNSDRTNYWEVVPTEALDLALWMESDRMGWLLPALTQAKLDTQREVVLNERRQSYENRPYGMVPMALAAAMYPPTHPYRWPTIGSPDDIRAATLDDVKTFFATYYHPGNASIVLAGDVAPGEALRLVERYFGGIAPGPDIPPVEPPRVGLNGDQRLVFEDRVEFPRLYLAWHSTALFGEGDADLDLAADVLAGGKTSRLYQRMVARDRIALDVVAYQSSREIGGSFIVAATAAPGHPLAALDEVMTEEVARLAHDGPQAGEVTRAKARVEAQFVYRLQTVGGFGGKSDQLNAYNVYLGDPGAFGRDLARYRSASVESIQTVAARWLTGTSRVALGVVPRGRGDLALPQSSPAEVS